MPDALRDEAVRMLIARGASVIDANEAINGAVEIGEQGAAEAEADYRSSMARTPNGEQRKFGDHPVKPQAQRRGRQPSAEERYQADVNADLQRLKSEFLERRAQHAN